MKQDNALGAGLTLGVLMFVLTACSFETEIPEEIGVVGDDLTAEEMEVEIATRIEYPVDLTIIDEPVTDDVTVVAEVVEEVAAAVVEEVAAEEVVIETRAVANENCSIATTTTGTLADARQIYENICSGYSRPDCDPASGGGWQCSSQQIGLHSPSWVTNKTPSTTLTTVASDNVTDIVIDGTTDTPTDDQIADNTDNATDNTATTIAGDLVVQTETQIAGDWEFVQDPAGYEGDGALIWLGDNNFLESQAGEGILTYNFNIDYAGVYEVTVRSHKTDGLSTTETTFDANNDVWIRVNGSSWRKVYQHVREDYADTNPFDVNLSAGTTIVELSGRSTWFIVDSIRLSPEFTIEETTPVITGDLPALPDLGYVLDYDHTFYDSYESGDLLALHYDSSYDADDMQAMIMAREILNERTDVDFYAINGTKRRDNPTILDDSTTHMQSLFAGSQDAFADNCGRASTEVFCQAVIESAADKWEVILKAGGRVHVADGGPMSFTSDVFRELISRNEIPTATYKNVRVIQHSWGFNEIYTTDEDLELIRRYGDYIRIANGNQGNEGGGHTLTSDFSDEADTTMAINFRAAALASQYKSQWALAFQKLSNKADGSDVVEVMWILGISKDTTPDFAAFSSQYF